MTEHIRRNIIIDFIKGIAIVAVSIYHFGSSRNAEGILPFGYLGVDIFFVIGGYLFISGMKSAFLQNNFDYWKFLFHKLIRLYPLIVIASFFSLVFGYIMMLPDDYENLAESVVASSLFLNNVLQCVTTRNYWDVAMHYKPLMHFWYIGVLFQFYIVMPLIYMVLKAIFKDAKVALKGGTVGVTAVSLFLFLFPLFPTEWKFYYFPFRLFEFTIGALIVYVKTNHLGIKNVVLTIGSSFMLIMMICSRWCIVSKDFMLLVTVISTTILISVTREIHVSSRIITTVALLGQRSYSFYIWHQVIIAILFYSLFEKAEILSFCVFVVITILISMFSYQYIEKTISRIVGVTKKEMAIAVTSLLFAASLCIFSMHIFINAGVVRDVPELNISLEDTHKNMHAEYCDRPYLWDHEFDDDKKCHILVIGSSFARDFANVLYEYDSSLDLSYKFYTKGITYEIIDRIENADYVFFALSGAGIIPEEITQSIPRDKLYIVGNKSFGESNGIIYSKRWCKDYYDQMVSVPQSIVNSDEAMREEYSDHFISMMQPVMINDKVRVFTNDHKYISQDCLHLTKMGAQYYSKILGLEDIL